jgi:hypothetical protein
VIERAGPRVGSRAGGTTDGARTDDADDAELVTDAQADVEPGGVVRLQRHLDCVLCCV